LDFLKNNFKTNGMPWTKTDYPNSMKNLPVAVRNKAIEIANALLEKRHMDEGVSIATAISKAKEWAVKRGLMVDHT
jgi:uncharacterized protein YdaT